MLFFLQGTIPGVYVYMYIYTFTHGYIWATCISVIVVCSEKISVLIYTYISIIYSYIKLVKTFQDVSIHSHFEEILVIRPFEQCFQLDIQWYCNTLNLFVVL